MAVSAVDITRSLLAYQVVNDRASLEKLLKRNGVTVPMNATDLEVTSAVLVASGKSQNFKNELSNLLATTSRKAGAEFKSFTGEEMGFTGIDDFSFTGGGEEFFGNNGVKSVAPPAPLKISPTPTATVKPSKTKKVRAEGEKTTGGKILSWIGQNLLTKENIDTAVQVGLTKINTKTQNKANQVAQEGLEIQEIQDDIRRKQASDGKKGLSTGAWIGIGLGAAALIGIIIYMTRRGGKQ
jgi:hypothetical protein